MRRTMGRALLAAALLSVATGAAAQTADEIVARNLEAKGGLEKWKAVNSLKMTGTITVQGKELPLTIYSKRPNLMRHEMAVGDFRVVQAFDGTRAWAINPMTKGKPQELPREAAEMIRNTAEFDGALVDYKGKGHAVELVGTESADGTEVHHLRLTMKNGNVQHYYIDAKTGLERRVTQQVDTGPGRTQTLSTEMRDFRPVSGVMIPHDVRQLVDGTVIGQMRITGVEMNTVDDDSIFRMPGGPAPAP